MPLTDHIRPEPNPPLTMERAALARTMYAEGFTASRICSHCLVSIGTLYACLDGVPFGAGGPRLPRVPRRRAVLGKRQRALKSDTVSLTNRLLRTAERQVRDIEVRLNAPAQSPVERERDVRMLTGLTRVLRDLQAMQKVEPAAMPQEPTRSLDELRTSLARKLEALIAERGQGGAPV